MDREGFHISKSELLYIWPDNLGIRKYLIGVRFFSSIYQDSVSICLLSLKKNGASVVGQLGFEQVNRKGVVSYLGI